MRIPVVLFLVLLFSCISCGKKKGDCTYTCRDINVYPVFPYTYSEVDTILVRRYVQDSTFTTLVDSLQYAVDTAASFYPYAIHVDVRENYDYMFIIPATGDSFKLTHTGYTDKNIVEECDLGHSAANAIHSSCYNDFPSYASWLNGQEKPINAQSPNAYTTLIRLSR